RRPGRKWNRDEFRCFQYGLADRRRSLRAIRHQDSRSSDRCQPYLHVMLLGKISDRRARRDKSRDRRKMYRANHDWAGIALDRLDLVHALESQLQVVTEP